MHLDVRLPIGYLFIIIGLILFGVGITSNPVDYAKSLDVNIDLWWGIVMGAFGGFMLFLAFRSKKKKAA